MVPGFLGKKLPEKAAKTFLSAALRLQLQFPADIPNGI